MPWKNNSTLSTRLLQLSVYLFVSGNVKLTRSSLSKPDACGVMEQKDEGGQQIDSPCGIQTQPGQAGLCE